MGGEITVAVLIAVHNRLEFTSRCISCLRSSSGSAKLKIIIIDDGSTDGTSEWLAMNAPDFIRLRGDGNQWFGGATELGIDYVKANLPDVDYIFSLNNDAFMLAGGIEALIAESKGNATVEGLVLSDRDGHIHSFGGFSHRWRGWVDPVTGWYIESHPELVRWISQAAEMLNTGCTPIPMKWI